MVVKNALKLSTRLREQTKDPLHGAGGLLWKPKFLRLRDFPSSKF